MFVAVKIQNDYCENGLPAIHLHSVDHGQQPGCGGKYSFRYCVVHIHRNGALASGLRYSQFVADAFA